MDKANTGEIKLTQFHDHYGAYVESYLRKRINIC